MSEMVTEFMNEEVRLLLMAAAVFVGLLVFVFLLYGLRSKRAEKSAEADKDDALGVMAQETEHAVPITSEPDAGMPELVLMPPATAEALAPDNLRDEARILEEIRQLEQQGDSVDLARLYTERGQLSLTAGDAPVAQEYFLKGLSMAGLVSSSEYQAVARASLGEISFADGDLTTACEHWQLARDLFRDCGEHDMAEEVEERMSANQCPTDWVLNEF